ncbi:MAG: UpxY family transcription antiterminator [Tannerella sp.]|jgi:transcription antitermination factor NusG|nr:UpxY family transcription antiterminator [Tannerella sp.]
MEEIEDEKLWFALYTKPRAEKKTKEKLLEAGVETFLPLHLTPRVWSDRIKYVEMPLFPSYIFVRCREKELASVSAAKGISRIVYSCGKPAVVKANEIENIRTFIELIKGRKLCTGEEVEILTGSMKKQVGNITRIGKKYLVLYIPFLPGPVVVDIETVVPFKRVR